ncbi:glucose-6-phosphate dehydrogenase [Frigoribacterium sp. CG_9.8]|uniref:glucose-6-phosphate dehydrogenase n=1 Tax=Frigoribacterium sp. CG_9.8 TaxID=2787733 RepID=UPI0018CBB3B1|nr:glucose-6-phosphate dehydrogenase [Frigoribacterium sp. CG_9.8]MBG6107317.1 glucose-6-phosphate 1-dehydrogenase [Frigoribacterium sp. CG_9.8]
MVDRIGTLVILGAGGDLAKRLLLPGLGQLLRSSRGYDLRLIGVGFDAMTDAEWRDRVVESFAAGEVVSSRSTAVATTSVYLQADVTDPADLTRILAATTGTPALYFALPPQVTIASIAALEKVGLPAGAVLGLEKPFGTDLRSARALNRQLARLLPEKHIHRVDHFLGKSTVLNLLGLRFANRIFEQVWSAEHIERVDIVFDETLGLEARAGYYDTAGALVDMIQSHLLLVMALAAMEPPSSLDEDDLRGSMAQVLRATHAWKSDPVAAGRRARYTAGTIDGRKLPAYVNEAGVHQELDTETLAEVTVGIENWRWAGVPFRLRSGKAIAERRQQIIVTFKDVPHRPYGFTGNPGPARLTISLTPDSIGLDLNINGEGDPFTLDRVTLGTEFAAGELGPYGEVLHGILSDDATLSVRADAVEECWRIVAPILSTWRAGTVPIDSYRAGSAGPTAWR